METGKSIREYYELQVYVVIIKVNKRVQECETDVSHVHSTA